MANVRQLVTRLKAVKNIRKITRTMELIATSRFKRAMDRATEASAYTKKLAEIVGDLGSADLKFTHPLLQQRETTENAVLLVLTSNRGLCGGYNGGVLRNANKAVQQYEAEDINYSMEVSGKRGIKFFTFQKRELDQQYTHFEDKPTFDEVEILANRFAEDFVAGKIDRLDVAYVEFETISRQNAVVETLLPIKSLDEGDEKAAEPKGAGVDYEFTPSAEEILAEIVPASFRARLFKCFLDAYVVMASLPLTRKVQS